MSFHRPITEDMNLRLQCENFAWPEQLVRVPKSQWPPALPEMGTLPVEMWRSRAFLLMVYREKNGMERLSITRTRADVDAQRMVDGITWDELQDLKRQCGRGDKLAVEIYPQDADIVNVSNMRHLWLVKDDLGFGWKRSRP